MTLESIELRRYRFMTLNQLQTGHHATIDHLAENNQALLRQCIALGLKPGEQVKVLHKGRGNSPMQIKCRGTLYAIRPNEAASINVVMA